MSGVVEEGRAGWIASAEPIMGGDERGVEVGGICAEDVNQFVAEPVWARVVLADAEGGVACAQTVVDTTTGRRLGGGHRLGAGEAARGVGRLLCVGARQRLALQRLLLLQPRRQRWLNARRIVRPHARAGARLGIYRLGRNGQDGPLGLIHRAGGSDLAVCALVLAGDARARHIRMRWRRVLALRPIGVACRTARLGADRTGRGYARGAEGKRFGGGDGALFGVQQERQIGWRSLACQETRLGGRRAVLSSGRLKHGERLGW
jgi:hypothetical protein